MRTLRSRKQRRGTSVFGNARIIERAKSEVNAMSGESRKVFCRVPLARTLIALAVGAALLASSCGNRERQAERLYRQANQAVDEGNFDEAVELYDRILDDYRGTDAAARAAEAVVLFRGLSDAVKLDPSRRATTVMIATARALDRYRSRNRRFPDGLAGLVPGYLDAVPADPWGRTLVYRVKSEGRGYVLSTLGSDAALGGSEDASDIVIEDSKFVRRGAGS